tara:strand:+ start:107 stop:517 length:411 start_codon:yes stop_codon:yes gene_type:complete
MEYLYTKIFILSLVSSLLVVLFINTKFHNFLKKYSKNKKIILNLLAYFILFFFLTVINYQTSILGLSSLVIFNAAIITIIYFELAIFLEKTFWDDFLGNSLPRSINLLISFVVMMNFGYFTLMFYIKVLGINYFVS